MISVIIPIYNCEKYIERCVESVMTQQKDGVDLEIILVNDGSTDDSINVCDKMKKRYPDFVEVVNKDNGGVSSARNAGMDAARGEYYFFADADDVVPEMALKKLQDATEKEAQLYMGEVWIYGARRQILYTKKSSYSKAEFIYEILTVGPTELVASGVWGKLFCAGIIKGNNIRFDEEYQNGEDGIFFAEYLKYVSNVEVLEGELPVYKLYRYDTEERESAVSYFYPDLFKFFLIHREMLINHLKGEKNINLLDIHQRYINDIIVLLVRAYAFENFFNEGELKSELKQLNNNEVVREAIKNYRRLTKGTSILIPYAIRKKNIFLLDTVLKMRGKKYRKIRYKGEKLKSIFRS